MKKSILLIGGSYGIGLEISNKMKEDYNIYVASRTSGGIDEAKIVHIPFDVTSEELDVLKLPGEIHGFVYCPGSISLKPFKMLSIDTFKQDMNLNFLALVKVVQTIMPRMSKNSSIVLFSTVAASKGMPFHTSVAAAKGAVEGFAKALAAEYAPKIRVNTIAPSLVDTPLSKRLLNNDRKRELMSERHPLKRFGKTTDIADMAAFLLGHQSTWITGQVFAVDGGISTLKIDQ